MRDDKATAEAPKNDAASIPLRRRKAHIRETNEAHLLACAEAVFAERGLEGASTAMIAERAGLPKANLHYYFPTKLALYRRVLEDRLAGDVLGREAAAILQAVPHQHVHGTIEHEDAEAHPLDHKIAERLLYRVVHKLDKNALSASCPRPSA